MSESKSAKPGGASGGCRQLSGGYDLRVITATILSGSLFLSPSRGTPRELSDVSGQLWLALPPAPSNVVP